MQKRAPGGSSAWQLEQRKANAAPQFRQKRASGGFSDWQRGQLMGNQQKREKL
jgi:hypothetical protein